MPQAVKRATSLGPADIAGLLGGPESSPSNETRMRAPTTAETIWDYSEPIRKISNFLLGDDDISQAQSALAPGPMAMTNIFPKNIQKLFSEQLAQKIWNEASSLGLDKLATAASEMIASPRHMGITSTLADIVPITAPGTLGSYKSGSLDWMKSALARKPLPGMAPSPNSKYMNAITNYSDEELAQYARVFGGEMNLSPKLEEGPVSEIYKTIRHELSHAADNLTGKPTGAGYGLRGNDSRYWVNLGEVRARASEPNYVRDMTGKAEPKHTIVTPSDPNSLFWKGEIKQQRKPYRDKVIDEINRGKDISDDILNRHGAGRNSTIPIPPSVQRDDLEQTVSHYFGSPGKKQHVTFHPNRVTETPIEPRLKLPGDKKYDWQKLIKNYDTVIESNIGKKRYTPTEHALEDLMHRLRGSE